MAPAVEISLEHIATQSLSTVEELPKDNECVTTSTLNHGSEVEVGYIAISYRVYKRRYIGLSQIVALTMLTSWNWIAYSTIPSVTTEYFNVSTASINLLSIVYAACLAACCMPVVWISHHRSMKFNLILGSLGLCIGSWIRYAGTISRSFSVVMGGQVVIGIFAPIAVISPAHYSDIWFSPKSRVSTTALMSLANALGAAIGQIIGPLIAPNKGGLPTLAILLAVMASIIGFTSFFIPGAPPTPSGPKIEGDRLPLRQAFLVVSKSPAVWIATAGFSVFVGFFNAFTTLLSQIYAPYGISNTTAGYYGAVLIATGLFAAACISPIIGKYEKSMTACKFIGPLISITYMLVIWTPGQSEAFTYVVMAILGGSSFTLMPIVLEWLVDMTYPIQPELTSAMGWMGGQTFGIIFLLVMQALKADEHANPPYNMTNSLIFEAVVALCYVPFLLMVGWFGINGNSRRPR